MASQVRNPCRREAASCSDVMNTSELLECILLQLDLRTLLTKAQLVCRSWRSLVQTSPSLQQKLFLLPIGTKNVANSNRDAHSVQLNPLLEDEFPPFFQGTWSGDLAVDLPWTKKKLKTFLRPDASWRRMLVSQPPVSKLGTVSFRAAQWFYYETVRVTKLQRGVRMADLFDLCFDPVLATVQIAWALRRHPLDNRWQMFAQKIWPYVQRAESEVDILVFLHSASSCCDEEDMEEDTLQPHQQIVEFVEKSETSSKIDKEVEWMESREGMFD